MVTGLSQTGSASYNYSRSTAMEKRRNKMAKVGKYVMEKPQFPLVTKIDIDKESCLTNKKPTI